jgi:hypothetical protein
VDSNCPERDRLVGEYLAAVNTFGDVVSGRASGRKVRQLTQQQKEGCQLALKAVLDHEHDHGCGKQRSG